MAPFKNGDKVVWIGQEFTFIGESAAEPELSLVERVGRHEVFYVETQILIDQNC